MVGQRGREANVMSEDACELLIRRTYQDFDEILGDRLAAGRFLPRRRQIGNPLVLAGTDL